MDNFDLKKYLAEGRLLKEDVEKISNEEFTIVYDADDMTDYKVYNRLLSDDEADEAEEDFKILNNLFFSFLSPSNKKGIVYFRFKAFFKLFS